MKTYNMTTDFSPWDSNSLPVNLKIALLVCVVAGYISAFHEPYRENTLILHLENDNSTGYTATSDSVLFSSCHFYAKHAARVQTG